MANETHVTIRGNLGKDPAKYGEQNVSARFSVAVEVSRFQEEKWVKYPPQWFRVKAFGQLATNVLATLHKGDPVIVHGDLRTEYWTDAQGQELSAQVVVAYSVGPDLRRVQAKVIRVAENQELGRATDFAPDQDGQSALAGGPVQRSESFGAAASGQEDPWQRPADVSGMAEAPDREANVA